MSTAPGQQTCGAVRIRRMRAGDVPRILEIERACFAVPWLEQTFRSLLERQNARLIVAELAEQVEQAGTSTAGRLQGYAALWVVGGEAELGNLAVDPKERRYGVGRALLSASLAAAERLGGRAMFLEVRASNTSARRLYEAEGFHQVGVRYRYYQKPVEDALVMRRPLHLRSLTL